MKLLVTGLCTLHWGRLEYGNIGNYYIIEPLFRELHRVFPDAEITTTFQMTDLFVERERVTVLPMSLYYSWEPEDIENAKNEYEIACEYGQTGVLRDTTPFIDVVRQADIVLDFSGDMWGDNAEHVGHGRFLVDLYKMRCAQLLGKKTVLFAGTPGPFSDPETVAFAKEVFSHFDLVPLREPMAAKNLRQWGFDLSKTIESACPAFLFEPETNEQAAGALRAEGLDKLHDKALVGFTICGFNIPQAPYDMWPRDDTQYEVFARAVEYIVNELHARVFLISHTNGFEREPNFRLINGRDWIIEKQLRDVLCKRGNIADMDDVRLMHNPHVPKEMKALLRQFDMFVTGRLHASCGAISQYIPTVFIMHGKSFIRSTKIQGFAQLAGVEDYVCEPDDAVEMTDKIASCWKNRTQVHATLLKTIPVVQAQARAAFDSLKRLLEEGKG